MSNGRLNRTIDTELRIANAATLTPGGAGSTANTTAVAIGSVGSGDADIELLINVETLTGTHGASNYIQLQLQASSDNSTFYTVTTATVVTIETGAIVLGLNTREITDVVGSQNSAYYRILGTQAGTTATAITLSAWFGKGN